MKARIKKIVLGSLLALLVLAALTKVCFEIDNYYYESGLRKMKNAHELDIVVKSKIEHKTLKLNGCEIHYSISANESEKSIVFLHPAFSDHTVFEEQIDYFSKDYRVISIDLIGHGLSKAKKSKDQIDASRDHIFKILEQEKVEKINLVGVSIGSLIAQHFALKYPEKVNSLTALGGYDINKENKDIAKAQRSSNIGLIVRVLFSMKAFRKKTAEITCYTKRGQALFYQTSKHYTRSSFATMQGLKKVVKNRNSHEASYPTFILSAEFDVDLAIEMAKSWHSDLENSEYFMIKDAGHCANLDKPDEFNKRVKDFLDRNN